MSTDVNVHPILQAHALFSVPEILALVLDNASRHCCTNAARVSSFWHDVALDRIWHTVDSMSAFSALFPCIQDESPDVFPPAVSVPEDVWERFFLHANRIRKLSRDADIDSNVSLSSRVYASLLPRLTSPGPNSLFQNIKTISWKANSDEVLLHVIPFLSPATIELSMDLSSTARVTPLNIAMFFGFLTEMPAMQIQTFRLTNSFSQASLSPSVTAWVQTQSKLVHISLPRFLDRTELIQVLSGLAGLRGIHMEYTENYRDAASPVDPTSFRFVEGQFEALREVALNVFAEEGLELFKNSTTTARLVKVKLTLLRATAEDGLHALVVSVSAACPLLETFSLHFPPTPIDSPSGDSSSLHWDTFQPLLRCTKLSSLRLESRSDVELTFQDVTMMGEAWPQMEDLHLCFWMGYTTLGASGMPISWLTVFANHFPILRSLSFPFKTTGILPKINIVRPLSNFYCLERLEMSTYEIQTSQVQSIGEYIGAVLPSNTALELHVTHRTSAKADEEWRAVWRVMHTVHCLRAVFEAELQREIASLREGRRNSALQS